MKQPSTATQATASNLTTTYIGLLGEKPVSDDHGATWAMPAPSQAVKNAQAALDRIDAQFKKLLRGHLS